VRTTTGTVWISPSGQLVEVPRPTTAPPSHDCDPHLSPALPSAQQLAETDAYQLTAQTDDDRPPWPSPVAGATERSGPGSTSR
jgi:hypothetical protein